MDLAFTIAFTMDPCDPLLERDQTSIFLEAHIRNFAQGMSLG